MRPWAALFVMTGLAVALGACTFEQGSEDPEGSGTGTNGPSDRPAGKSATLRSIVAGHRHTCGVAEDGTVHCWGSNGAGQLGDGSREDRGYAVTVDASGTVDGFEDVVEVSLGRAHTCARMRSGKVACWGGNSKGQLGDSSGGNPGAHALAPVAVRGLVDAVALSSGADHSCAMRKAGSVVCWGSNADGQLGNENRPWFGAPVAVSGLEDATQLVAGAAHTCALRETGKILCWGQNKRMQLGDGTKNGRARAGNVAEISAAVSLSAKGAQTCARERSGEVACWGAGKPLARVAAARGSDSIDAGDQHACARRGGRVQCWGEGKDGRLGDGGTKSRSAPVTVVGLSDVVDLAIGYRHSCALRRGGQVSCWGDNGGAALGSGPAGGLQRAEPTKAADLEDAVSLAAGDDFVCALRRTGQVLCWGANDAGQLGDARTEDKGKPTPVPGLGDQVSISVGPRRTCAVQKSGSVSCWGEGSGKRPTPVAGIRNAVEVAVGGRHACVRNKDGQVSCWGDNAAGQLGDGKGGKEGAASKTPVTVKGISDAVELDAGDAHTCARRASGGVVCWGARTFGQLGDGAGAADLKTPRLTATSVLKLADAVELSLGPDYSCARRATGAVACFGRNDKHQLGSGTTSHWTTRIPVRDIRGAVAVATGNGHACVQMQARQTRCWGQNDAAQLGDSSGQKRPTPGPGPSVDAVELVAGLHHTCARLRSGEVACWGDNRRGQLGDGSRAFATVPAAVDGLD